MRKNLLDVVEIVENNKDFILLEFIGNKKDMILTGVLDGNEEMVRITKDETHVMTIYYKDGTNTSFHWGMKGHTLLSENLENKRKAIAKLIEDELETSLEKGTQLDFPQSKSEVKGRTAEYKVMYFDKSKGITIHKNGHYLNSFNSIAQFLGYLKSRYKRVNFIDRYVAGTGCTVELYDAIGRK